MSKLDSRWSKRKRRHRRIQSRLRGTSIRPRLCVFRSARSIYAQIIDDDSGMTLVTASSPDTKALPVIEATASKSMQAKLVGEILGERAKKKGIVQVVFDRAGYQFHGRVKALAEGARSKGLKF